VTASLPEGVVTFLFTDIEGSTRLLTDIGSAAYATALRTHADLVERAVSEERGVVFGTEGDAVFAAFASANGAVRASVAAQRAISTHDWDAGPIRVRMGIHSGEVLVSNDDYVGLEVHRAARVAAAAHGGQVVLTDAARVLAAELGDGVALRDLGEHHLKDFPDAQRLYQVEAAGLEATFPALRTLDRAPNNLPPQLTSFVGRSEVDRAVALLDRTRLLTLTGPGGTGKTRLSLALAGDCFERYPDGTWFVPLAPVTDPELVASAIAASIGLLAPQRPPIERVKDHLRDRNALLVLDNFEQVVSGAPVVADLLRSAPRLTVIVSSRAPLRISGEQEFPVPPLGLPPAGATRLPDLVASEAVRLFVERAMAVRPEFELTPENGPPIAEIVRRLDGLPLAIELAAARIRLLPPAAIAQRLNDRLGLLSAGGRDLPERQRTLRGAIDWSHDLLDEDDRRLFARLGVFAGGGPLETAESVCGIDVDEGPLDVFGGLERLADQSLLRVESDLHGDVRFTMLETIREYALEKLEARGETRALRDRHASAFISFVDSAGDESLGGGATGATAGMAHAHRLDRIEDEHDNIRAALDHLVATGDVERAARLAFAVWRFWQMRGHIIEGRARVDRILAMPGSPTEPTASRLRVLEAAGGLAYWGGALNDAYVHYAAAVDLARRLGDDHELAEALYNLNFARRPTADDADWVAQISEDDTSLVDEAIAIWTRLGDEHGMARALWAQGEHYAYRGEFEKAEDATTRALAIFEREGDPFWIGWSRFTRAFARVLAHDPAGAAADIGPTLRDFWTRRDLSAVVLLMSGLSTAILLAGRAADGYAVSAAANRIVAETGLHLASIWPTDQVPVPDLETQDAALRAAIALGASWSRDEAVDRAVALAAEVAAGLP
jgi:predicted ATPase/class 3 adenylate cyclase